MKGKMFADDVESRFRNELYEHIRSTAMSIYSHDQSSGIDITKMYSMGLDELLRYDMEIEEEFYKTIGRN